MQEATGGQGVSPQSTYGLSATQNGQVAAESFSTLIIRARCILQLEPKKPPIAWLTFWRSSTVQTSHRLLNSILWFQKRSNHYDLMTRRHTSGLVPGLIPCLSLPQSNSKLRDSFGSCRQIGQKAVEGTRSSHRQLEYRSLHGFVIYYSFATCLAASFVAINSNSCQRQFPSLIHNHMKWLGSCIGITIWSRFSRRQSKLDCLLEQP